MEFDPAASSAARTSTARTLKQLDAQIARLKAQQLLRDEQSLTDKMMAAFGVERARLDASKGEVVPAVENEKNLMALGKAERKVREVEQQIDIQSDRCGSGSGGDPAQARKGESSISNRRNREHEGPAPDLAVDGLLMLQPEFAGARRGNQHDTGFQRRGSRLCRCGHSRIRPVDLDVECQCR